MRTLIIGGVVAVAVLVSAGSGWAHEGHQHHGAQTTQQQESGEETAQFDPALLGFSGLREVFNVHPIFVHFPIALFPSALLLYGLGIIFNWRTVCSAGRACLYLAAAGVALAVMTGWMAQETFPHNARIHHMMQTHKAIGLWMASASLLLVGWSFLHKAQRPRGAYPFLGLLVLVTYLALQNGDLGARMVFIEGAAVKPAVPVITGQLGEDHETHSHDHEADEAVPHHHTH